MRERRKVANSGRKRPRDDQGWCGREDSNFHGLPHSDLNAARLPIPPRPPVVRRGVSKPDRLCEGRWAPRQPMGAKPIPLYVPEARWSGPMIRHAALLLATLSLALGAGVADAADSP